MRRFLAWNVFFRTQEFLKGHPTIRILREMEAADRLSASELADLQAERLHRLIDHCYRSVPYYSRVLREAGVRPNDIRTAADLRYLPVMRKSDVRQHRAELRSTTAARLSSLSTGGSSGEPLLFDIAPLRTAARIACRQRVSRWWGLSLGDAELALWGSPVELTRQDRIRNIRDWFLATRLLPAFEMNETTTAGYLDLLERIACRQIFGYPSAIFALCQQARKERRNLRRLGVRAVFVTGEVLLPFQREIIADTLNCPVANGYGGRDSGFIAHECPQGGMHVLSDAAIVEILDEAGHPVPAGEAGEIVVTDLYSPDAPFIRYGTGDVAIASSRRCVCGRALPLLESIEGRLNDSIITPDGRVINSLSVIYAVREVPGIQQFRIRQTAVDEFRVEIVRDEHYRNDGEERVRAAWTALLRCPVKVHFEYPDVLSQERSGKLRHVISEVRGADTLRTCLAHSVGEGS